MNSVNIYATVTVFVLMLIIVSIFSTNKKIKITDDTNNVPDRYLVVEHKWKRAFNGNCRYQFRIEGFAPMYRDHDRLRHLILIDDCDAYDKGDILAITKI